MSQTHTFDPSIPVLTEILGTAAEEIAVAEVVTPEPASEVAAQPRLLPETLPEALPEMSPEAQPKTPVSSAWSAAEREALVHELSQRILDKLQGRIVLVVQQQVTDVLHQTLRDLSGEIRHGLQQTIEKIVIQAINQELTQLPISKE